MTFHSVGNGIIIPTDKLIFFRGVGYTTNQVIMIIVIECRSPNFSVLKSSKTQRDMKCLQFCCTTGQTHVFSIFHSQRQEFRRNIHLPSFTITLTIVWIVFFISSPPDCPFLLGIIRNCPSPSIVIETFNPTRRSQCPIYIDLLIRCFQYLCFFIWDDLYSTFHVRFLGFLGLRPPDMF